MTRIRISLLPDEMRRQSSIMKVWTVIALVLAIIAMILLAANILFSFYIKQPADELESLKVENSSITQNIGRLSYIQDMFDKIDSNNADIKTLRGVDPDWGYTMDMVSADAGVFGIKIKRMDIIAAGDSPGCVLSCWTSDIENIERWSAYIKQQDGIGYVQVADIMANVFPGNQIDFEFNAFLGIDRWADE